MVDRHALSSRLDVLESYLAELRPSIAGKMKIHGESFDSVPEEDWQPR